MTEELQKYDDQAYFCYLELQHLEYITLGLILQEGYVSYIEEQFLCVAVTKLHYW